MRTLFFSFILLIAVCASKVPAASPAEVKQAISKGATYLTSVIEEADDIHKGLLALAAYKGGVPVNSPSIQHAIQHIESKFEGGSYKPGHEHLYEAGVEATLLADIDPEKYKPQLQAITDYIIGQQMSSGGWDYPGGGHGSNSVGDTSVIQYVLLGLWASSRAGIEVPPKIWEDVLLWHAKHQNSDGGFSYCPGIATGEGNGQSTLNMTVNAVGSMHIAMLQIDPEFMPLSQDRPKAKPNPGDENQEDKPKFGVLESIKLDEPKKKAVSVTIPGSAVQAVRRAYGHVTGRYAPENQSTGNKTYYYYSLERMSALANVEQIGSHDWFNECSSFIINKQQADGSWDMSKYWEEDVDTAFCVLFLTRSTGKLLKRKINDPQYGDGLLAGGRGLPDDLSDVNFDGRSIKGKEKPKGPLDELLASLTTSGAIDVEEVQEQIVEKVQLGDREELVKQTDMLVKLVDNPQAEIRRTAAWALGRTDNMELAQHLINLLNDSDLGVMLEARRALCWLSRKPKGFGLPDDPLEELPANATKQQQRDAITNWHKKAVLLWGEWYLYNRPFEDRGDEFEAILRAKMEGLKSGV